MSLRPKISVLLPTYKYARFLPQAIDSILAQDLTDYELIISDDASNDGTDVILNRYAKQDSRLRVSIHATNLGMVANWNKCLHEARGEYVKYVFGDDLLFKSTALQRLATMLDENPAATLAASARQVIDDNARPLEIWNELGTKGRHDGAALIRRCLEEDRNLIGEPTAVLFRRQSAKRDFDPRWNQLVDLEFWLNLLSSGDLMFDPEPLCAFRVHGAQQSCVNGRSNVSPAERLHLFARYGRFFFSGRDGAAGSAEERKALFRCLYYSRNYAPRTSENCAAEVALDARLMRGWYTMYLFRHRLFKPFANCTNRFRSRQRPRK